MGFRFRKTLGKGPLKMTVSKSGIGYSVGSKGFRVTKKAGGGTRTTASIPGTGISYTSDSKKGKKTTAKHSATTKNAVAKTSAIQTKSRKTGGCLTTCLWIFGICLVIGLSLIATVVMSKILACVLPFIAKLLKLDPAMMAAPLISTIVDALSLVLYFTIAAMILPI